MNAYQIVFIVALFSAANAFLALNLRELAMESSNFFLGAATLAVLVVDVLLVLWVVPTALYWVWLMLGDIK